MFVAAMTAMAGSIVTGQQPSRVAPETAAPTSADFEWLGDHYKAVLDDLMPMRTGRDAITYRHYDGFRYTDPEAYFVLEWDWPRTDDEARVSARATVPDGDSLRRQFVLGHIADRTASVASLRARIKVRTVSTTAATCAPLSNLISHVPALSFDTPRNRLWIDPPANEVVFEGDDGVVMATLKDSGHPLVRWADQTLKALLSCVDNAPRS
jgi:hypothetical protein